MASAAAAKVVDAGPSSEVESATTDPMSDVDPVPVPAMAATTPNPAPPSPALDSAIEDDGSRDLAKLAIFVVVTVVVGLIGFAVAGRFTPRDIPEGEEAAGPVVSSTTTSRPGETTTSEVEVTTTTAGATSPPPNFQAGTDSVDFGEEATSAEFAVTNSGGSAGEISISTSSEAIAPSVDETSLAPGDTATIQLSLDRDEIEEGDIAETITVAWSGGDIEIAAVGSHEDNPIIHNPQANPPEVEVDGGAACLTTQSTVSARVRDTSPLESVVVRWNDGSSSRETAMSDIGEDIFEGVIGPFNSARTAEVRIVAFDERGNAGGAVISVNVLPCP